jgi:hypothetical protein
MRFLLKNIQQQIDQRCEDSCCFVVIFNLLLMDIPRPVFSIKAGGHEGFDYEVTLTPVQVATGTL